MADFSFDIVSKVNMHDIEDAVNIANKEIVNRYDFKDTKSSIELKMKENELFLTSSDEFKVKALFDVLVGRIAKKDISLKNFELGKIESALGGTAKQTIKIQQGIPSEKAKEISRTIKDSKLKATASIKGDEIRVTSRSKDTLQEVMALLKAQDFGLELQFVNYR